MFTLNIKTLEELNALLYSNVSFDKDAEASMFTRLTNIYGVDTAIKRMSCSPFHKEELDKDLVGYQLLTLDMLWRTILHSYDYMNNKLIVFEDDPKTLVSFDSTGFCTPRVYDIRKKSRKHKDNPIDPDWIIEPVPSK